MYFANVRRTKQLIVMAGSRKYVGLVLFVAVTLCCTVVKTEEVIISQGKVRGTTLTSRNGRNFSAFLGIPYARPPIGVLRFKNPLPADSWNDTYVADTDGNECPQYDDAGKPVGYEDCLYLNVYTPKITTTSLYPTMVFIHGGAFIKGNGGSKYVAPGYIMDKDVVFVSMNYRLGVLGFLSTGDAEATGNFGLKDQVLALRWIKENVKEFGGDPDRVTLIGQSAGSVSVNLHVLSDASAGLFNQYITHSGSSLCFWAYHEITDYKKHSVNLGKYVNCPTNNSRELIDCLRDTDVYTLVDTNDIFGGLTTMFNTWVPTNEPSLAGAFLTTSPIDRILKNSAKDYPWITGNVADEGLVVTTHLYTNETLYDTIASDTGQFLRQIATSFIDIMDPNELASNVRDFYLLDVNPKDKHAFIKCLTNLMSDAAFLFPVILQMQIALQRMRNPFYFYSFQYRGSYSITNKFLDSNQSIGVAHTDDLLYIFPTSAEVLGVPEIKLSPSDERIVDTMINLWTSFAYNGVPTLNYTDDLHIWQPYDKNMRYLQIGETSEPSLKLKTNFLHERMRFWTMQVLKVVFTLG